MATIKNDFEPLEDFSNEQFKNLEKSIEALEEDDKRWNKQRREEEEIRSSLHENGPGDTSL